jgi:hypothetical protein
MVDRGEMESRSEASVEQRERKYEDREVAIVRIPYFLFFFFFYIFRIYTSIMLNHYVVSHIVTHLLV